MFDWFDECLMLGRLHCGFIAARLFSLVQFILFNLIYRPAIHHDGGGKYFSNILARKLPSFFFTRLLKLF